MKFKRFIILTLIAVISLGVSDWTGMSNIIGTQGLESFHVSAAKRKSKKKSSKRTKKRTSKRKVTSSKRATATVPPVETPSNDSLTLFVNENLIKLIPQSHNPGGLRVNSVKTDSIGHKSILNLNENFTYLPINSEYIELLEKNAAESMPDSLSDFKIELKVSGKPLSYYINTIDKLPKEYRENVPFVRPATPLSDITKGMQGDNVALWHSHGKYYKSSGSGWYWQRGFLFQAIEDTYTLGYILPYVVPMLENAGAYVMLPRERDINPLEVIVDNDQPDESTVLYSQSTYGESDGKYKWETGEGEGFIYDLPDFRDTENPFENGSYRQVKTTTGDNISNAVWAADIPESREYAIYVSYKSLPNSAEDALYTINYDGGSDEILVNQKLGGGTWIYLGTYPLEKGLDMDRPVVSLSNHSQKGGNTVVTADAVKIGGGMGNIARSPKRSDVFWNNVIESSDTDSIDNVGIEIEGFLDEDESKISSSDLRNPESVNPFKKETQTATASEPIFKTSGLPRWMEGARYWLHWAGMPDSIYAPYGGTDDYKDDYTNRGLWVNYLAGGSRVLPNEKGLGIPIDVVMALHSDAGKRADDSFVGTLGIYFTNGNANYSDGTPRKNSRTLTDMLMRQITGDIRVNFEPNWTRRSMWDKTYVEARVPEVPTSLIELLSHQNFADMQYGNDPRFRFTVGRAIYKALARFVGERKDRKVVIQPLPVHNFAIQKTGKKTYRLSWQATPDATEPTAMPEGYLIMERSGDDMSFHKVAETSKTHFDIQADDDEIHSFRIIAFNDGGRSFPSETLAFRYAGNDSEPVLIINGFTRVSGPAIIKEGNLAGFDTAGDFGVPYIYDVSFTGPQTEFNRNAGEAFGKSSDRYVSDIIAGNTFDFPAIHGKAIEASGRGFVSTSVGAVEQGSVNLQHYKVIDLILGSQKATIMGTGQNGAEFIAFPRKLRSAISSFQEKGGRLLVSGQYVASDLSDTRGDLDAAKWGREVLGIQFLDSVTPTVSGRIDGLQSPLKSNLKQRRYSYSNTLNDKQYIVQHPDALIASPDADEAAPFLRFSDTDNIAGLLTRNGKSRKAIMSVPFESISDPNQRILLMKELLDWLEK
ncbi:MAG: xanthan lyase [Muribaculum sp.]|nr:xanthan lyase [Muribaculum sp.]